MCERVDFTILCDEVQTGMSAYAFETVIISPPLRRRGRHGHIPQLYQLVEVAGGYSD